MKNNIKSYNYLANKSPKECKKVCKKFVNLLLKNPTLE